MVSRQPLSSTPTWNGATGQFLSSQDSHITNFQPVRCDFGKLSDKHKVVEVSVSTKDYSMSTSDGKSTEESRARMEDNWNVAERESSEESISV